MVKKECPICDEPFNPMNMVDKNGERIESWIQNCSCPIYLQDKIDKMKAWIIKRGHMHNCGLPTNTGNYPSVECNCGYKELLEELKK